MYHAYWKMFSKKFRFCGELDCPDWVLAEIATISKIVSEFLLTIYMLNFGKMTDVICTCVA